MTKNGIPSIRRRKVVARSDLRHLDFLKGLYVKEHLVLSKAIVV